MTDLSRPYSVLVVVSWAEELEWKHEGRTWIVTVHLTEVDGRAECTGLDLRSFRQEDQLLWRLRGLPEQEQAEGIVTSTLVRTLPVGRLVTDAKRVAAWRAEGDVTWEPSGELQDGDDGQSLVAAYGRMFESYMRSIIAERQPVKRLKALRNGGRPPIVDYAEVARVYLSAPTNPTKAVADKFYITRSAAAKQVARARELGYLAPTSRGKTSGRGSRRTA